MIAYITAALFSLAGFLKKHSKILTVLLFIYMWIIMGTNTYSPDFPNYEIMYHNWMDPSYSLHEPAFIALCALGNYLGLSFIQFRMFLALIYLTLMVLTIRQYTANVNLVMTLFLVFPFLYDVSVIRNAMANIIICFAIQSLFSQKKGSSLKYILGVGIAALFHYSCMFYIVLLLAKARIRLRETVLLLLVVIPGGILLTYTSIPLNIARMITSSVKILTWLDRSATTNTSIIGILTSSGLLMINLLLINRAQLLLSHKLDIQMSAVSGSAADSPMSGVPVLHSVMQNAESLRVFKNINIYIFLVIPFLAINLVYLRLFYAILLINYSVIAQAIAGRHDLETRSRSRELLVMAIIWSLFLFFFFYYGNGNLLLPILKNNLVFMHS
jgi:hypothetical protein